MADTFLRIWTCERLRLMVAGQTWDRLYVRTPRSEGSGRSLLLRGFPVAAVANVRVAYKAVARPRSACCVAPPLQSHGSVFRLENEDGLLSRLKSPKSRSHADGHGIGAMQCQLSGALSINAWAWISMGLDMVPLQWFSIHYVL